LCAKYAESIPEEQRAQLVKIKTQHIDGSMDSMARDEKLFWLKEEAEDPDECRVLTNVRCLSEGVDVPALDAVLFMSPRNSQVDVVQSVGRVMRNFRRGEDGEKKYGYIIIPVIVPAGVKPEDALQDNERFKVVWDILNALRSHDDHFNAEVNAIALNKEKTSKVLIGGVPQYAGNPHFDKPTQDEQDAKTLSDAEVAKQLEIRFGDLQGGIYAKLVEKVGDRMYWENWAKEVGVIAQKFIVRIGKAIHERPEHQKVFGEYLKCLQDDINPSVDETQAVEMLAQHIITGPVFDALFSEYKFVENNSVSQSMQRMIDLLKKDAFDKDTDALDKFYDSVRVNVGRIDNLEGKQTVIKNLYEKFFKGAFPKTVEKLGIVYTPVECVDFIIHSVNDILKKEFDCCVSDENVHILDPFVGTGTFITRLLQSGLIKKEDMMRKYQHEIHCCEIVLLSYYIADVNIESVFHDEMHLKEYMPYDGICLTDTFQTAEEREPNFDKEWFGQNSENVEELIKAPVRVIIGNPPYSVGQKSANDNAQNITYQVVDGRIGETYAAQSTATLRNSLYDSYIKAFRWASDKLAANKDGGVIGFISNGAWLDGNAQDGFRKCLQAEFSTIYVLNLRGNARTSGELRRKEGDGVFGMGSRTPISITLLVKKPNHTGNATIYYHDIGDYLKREDKLKMLKDFRSISTNKFEWVELNPDENGDWISHRNNCYDSLIILGNKEDKSSKESVFVPYYGRGLATSRDTWCYNSNKNYLISNIKSSIKYYNETVDKFVEAKKINTNLKVEDFIDFDSTKFSWDRAQKESDVPKGRKYAYDDDGLRDALYRPFFKQNCYFNRNLNNCVYQLPQYLPTSSYKNRAICVKGIGDRDFSCLITDILPDLQVNFNGQCFPLYYYSENNKIERSLFDNPNEEKYIRHDGVSDWMLKQVHERYHSKAIKKEMIFYFVYGLLHCKEYRETFAVDLKKSLPRIPIPEKAENFISFYQAGKALADLHLNYETVQPQPDVIVEDTMKTECDDYDRYRVTKMKFLAKDRKDVIIYNSHITISNIPAKTYEYIVNGKSAIEWILERYCVSVDKKSGIKNDANDWGREHNQPRYILDLLLSVINVSCQTVDIVNGLPRMVIDEQGGVSFTPGTWRPAKTDIVNLHPDDTPQQPLTVPHSSKEHTLRLPIKQVFMDLIRSGKKDKDYRDLTTDSARLYLKMDKDGRLYLNPKNVTEGKEYHIDDYNGGKFPFLFKDIKVLNLHVGDGDSINIEVIDIVANPHQYDADGHATWQIQFHLGKLIK
jgi:predicted helicase